MNATKEIPVTFATEYVKDASSLPKYYDRRSKHGPLRDEVYNKLTNMPPEVDVLKMTLELSSLSVEERRKESDKLAGMLYKFLKDKSLKFGIQRETQKGFFYFVRKRG